MHYTRRRPEFERPADRPGRPIRTMTKAAETRADFSLLRPAYARPNRVGPVRRLAARPRPPADSGVRQYSQRRPAARETLARSRSGMRFSAMIPDRDVVVLHHFGQ